MNPAPIATLYSKRLEYAEIERVLSKPRLDSYRQPGETHKEALCRHLWNTALCESLYPSLQTLEVTFRNALHSEIGAVVNEREWLTNPPGFLFEDELSAIGKAKQSLRHGRGITEPCLVAEMSFGFWTSLLDSRYDKMWPKLIAKVFPNMPRTIRTRLEVSRRMNKVRKLRNAALHHHSIWHWRDLESQHQDLHTVLEWLSPSMSMIARECDRFPTLRTAGPKQFEALVSKLSD
jgi:hypothetical protein